MLLARNDYHTGRCRSPIRGNFWFVAKRLEEIALRRAIVSCREHAARPRQHAMLKWWIARPSGISC